MALLLFCVVIAVIAVRYCVSFMCVIVCPLPFSLCSMFAMHVMCCWLLPAACSLLLDVCTMFVRAVSCCLVVGTLLLLVAMLVIHVWYVRYLC